jgi:type I restriction enzyme S subunit
MSVEVPDGWTPTTLQEVALGKGEYGANVPKGGYDPSLPRYVRITDISDDGTLIPSSLASISHEAANGYLLSDGDLLFARSGATVGKTFLYDSRYGSCAFAGYLIRFRLDPKRIDSRFARSVVQSQSYWEWVRSRQRAQAQPNINAKEYADLPILLPPLDEQRRIADVLRSVDETIAAAEAVHAAALHVQQATFAAFLSKGNDQEDGQTIEGWSTGAIRAVKQLPLGWQIVRLIDVAQLESGHTPDRKKPEYWENGNVEWLSLHDTPNLEKTDISKTELRITQAGLANSSARLLPAGTVCFSRTATVGKCVIMSKPMSTSQDFANFVCSPRLNNRYLLHLMRWMQPVWKALASGSTHKTIYMPTFKALQIILPPRVEQDHIAAAMDELAAVIEHQTALANASRRIKRALMADLLSGRVRVPA